MKNWAVFDLDGTLANVDHRLEHLTAGDWETFGALCGSDGQYDDIVRLAQLLSGELCLMLLSGRNERQRGATTAWLGKVGILADELLLRPDGDFSKDGELKIRLLEEYFGSKDGVLSSVLVVFEDRERVVAALRDYGLSVAQVREGQT